ncbi:P1 family peptidase [Hydrogenibacillus schlegelii]|uniref:Peptidase S58 n=1 Tax=Hydrogenibacillus schlegelii TaxID=1484 RepID=A0A179INC5_HYDSH|nr:P1 family peptidase [Hydrogenibacillus schlegelii]OAR03200.1 peptidase S58 [Hydrogenibacillus schlegelii]
MTDSPFTITAVPGVKVGHAEDAEALTGVTVVRVDQGAVGGVSVRGSAPATRETDALNPLGLVDVVHAVVLAGGSAFGLDAAGGVVQYLEEQGIGLDTGAARVPIVPAAALYDLAIGCATVRPNREMGYAAAARAGEMPVEAQGNVGAGTGATVGKLFGMERAMKGGLGTAARRLPGGLIVGAIVAVNAVGEVRDPQSGAVLAGVRCDDGDILPLSSLFENPGLRRFSFFPDPGGPAPGTATTIGVVATNAKLTKGQATKVADMAHGGLVRTIYPVHTMFDGDAIFALATGEVEADVNWVGTVAADVMAEAVVRAVKAARGAGGVPAWRDLTENRSQ